MDGSRVELRHLRAFVAVAEELNFTRAAARLRVGQPALSQTVRALEAELGVAVFTRSTRAVALTDAGRELLERARPALAGLQAALEHASAGQSASARLRVAFKAGGVGPLLPEVLQAFSAAHPDVPVELQRLDWTDEAAAVRAGAADVALVRPPVDARGLRSTELLRDRRVVGLATWHRLARHASVTLADLAEEPVVTSAHAPRELVDFWTVNPRPDGRTPRWGPSVRSNEEMLEHVALGHAVCLAAATVAHYYPRPDVVFRPVTDLEALPLLAITPAVQTPAARHFTRLAATVAAEQQRQHADAVYRSGRTGAPSGRRSAARPDRGEP